MKKLFVIILCFLFCGCSNSKSVESQQFDEYHQIQDRLLQQTKFDVECDFDVYVVYNELENQYRYDLIIDNPDNLMYDITAMCYCNENIDDIFPCIGIFDDDLFHLKKDCVNKEEGYYKGIQLSGVSSMKEEIKLYVSYYDEKNDKIELFLEVSDEIR